MENHLAISTEAGSCVRTEFRVRVEILSVANLLMPLPEPEGLPHRACTMPSFVGVCSSSMNLPFNCSGRACQTDQSLGKSYRQVQQLGTSSNHWVNGPLQWVNLHTCTGSCVMVRLICGANEGQVKFRTVNHGRATHRRKDCVLCKAVVSALYVISKCLRVTLDAILIDDIPPSAPRNFESARLLCSLQPTLL